MTDKLHCPFCGAELKKELFVLSQGTQPGDVCEMGETGRLFCSNIQCPMCDQCVEIDVWRLLWLGAQAQKELNAAKEYYVIVRGYGKEQHYISFSTGVDWFWNWDLDHAEPFDTIQDAKDQIRAAKIPHARVMKVRRFTEIASITKMENE